MEKRLLIIISVLILITLEVTSFTLLNRQKRYYDYQAQQDASQKQAEEEQEQQAEEEQKAQQEEQQEKEQEAQEQENNADRYKRSMVHNAIPVIPSYRQPMNYQTVNPVVPSDDTHSKTCIDYLRLIFSLLLQDSIDLVFKTMIIMESDSDSSDVSTTEGFAVESTTSYNDSDTVYNS